jgi:hypothetical protein
MIIDIIGIIYDITGDVENPTATPKPGWHVNSTEPVPEWAEWQVTPDIPSCVFAGVETYHYRFDSEQHFDELMPEGAE